MDQISNILVSLNIEGKTYEVGELAINNQTIYFRYHLDFFRSGLNISPIRLPFNNEINTTSKEPFDGLYGVFNDSLPDGWGRLLLDRTLSSKGIDIHGLTPLDRLAYVGDKGMGALSYQPQFEDKEYQKKLELDIVAREMSHILKGESTELLDELFAIGGSSGGARPKILVGYNKNSSELIHGVNDLPEEFEDWIIKFPSSSDNQEIANIEYTYYKMALAAGIEMSECQIFHGQSGQAYFGTRRFDRIQGQRLHMHTACGIMHDNFRMSTMDYGHLMDCAFQLERHVNAYQKVLRLAAFNVFAHNHDDHSKNFAFLMNGEGQWRFAPAYDLTFSNSAYGFHSTMVAGESKNPGKEHLFKLAETFKVKKANQIIEEVLEAICHWDSIANDSGVSKRVREEIQQRLNLIR
ncbi:type II toxin-antitoxin system HipA family toxin [Carboxylicivirga marina]|uniref:Type II toxin-antitoxin system HipA family toxin n=1 Tax=Carboxylicivirga marina TaxID=2800988 RepID=A0ABS1HJC5_9BACT|nr:type II toxin-antitoxin system HipA family toxin [Carboxylicivirga marina]MBK3517378.1 type II toxin-antitoxin system HipA family toxin [Carboxylicivirga marina]